MSTGTAATTPATGRGQTQGPAQRPRRGYDSTRRREGAAQTRWRIVAAGSELLHASPVRDWGALTVRAVAQRAGVHERTVYRHFENERALREALMQRLEEEAGIDLEGMDLDDVARVTRQMFRHVASFPLAPRPALDPTFSEANRRQHAALLRAVTVSARGWSAEKYTMAAAMLDVLWSVGAYERLVRDWELDPDQAIRAIGWVIDMVETAVRRGRGPGAGA